MSDPNQNPKKLLSSLSPSSSLGSEPATSPTSILELPKAFTSVTRTTPSRYPSLLPWDNVVGLAIVQALINDESDDNTRRILLATKLKLQIPAASSTTACTPSLDQSLCSPIEFGIKTKEMQLALYNNSPANLTSNTTPKCTLFTGSLSPREIELSEDYTCVIIHGPIPKTTHIFDNCVIESCAERSSASRKYHEDKPPMLYPSDKFLSHCGNCNKSLSLGEDIYIYKGEIAYCTEECRSQGMMLMEEEDDDEDERGAEKGLDDHGKTCFL